VFSKILGGPGRNGRANTGEKQIIPGGGEKNSKRMATKKSEYPAARRPRQEHWMVLGNGGEGGGGGGDMGGNTGGGILLAVRKVLKGGSVGDDSCPGLKYKGGRCAGTFAVRMG